MSCSFSSEEETLSEMPPYGISWLNSSVAQFDGTVVEVAMSELFWHDEEEVSLMLMSSAV
eukprot:CAMPEP_0195063944 /NCGR_PEP_ID=MMETSP0448-20130528/10195_1 /TAXON_ID=66468 /ORGANISM="Heterocapsa triquestra, Strain CCMP 448" /LENGTH=59 /DNA_ID=CAMNT_0040094915 /DNA_START=29 /DNA_END=205 /DNA_ORIENTATION=-